MTHRPRDAMVAVLLAALAAGCAARQPEHRTEAAGGTDPLGTVPIPPAPGLPTPLAASVGHPQLLAIGAPIAVRLPDGSAATVTALGPQVRLPPDAHLPLEQAPATITIQARQITGRVDLVPTDFSVRDDRGRTIPLTQVGEPTPSTGPDTAELRLTGEFPNGSAQITWRYRSTVLALWVFTTELD